MQRDHYVMIVQLYTIFYSKIYKNDKYVFVPSEKAEKQIYKFIEFLKSKYGLESIGVNFLITYFVFQFGYWLKLELEEKSNFSDRIQLPFIIGNKAIERWQNRNVNFDWTLYQSNFVQQYKISTSQIKDLFKHDQVNITNLAEEKEKKKFFNADKGLLHCIDRTTLFNNRSAICITCKNKDVCKQLLKDNYLHIYIGRGYNNK